jgi:hypothetical protein
MINQARKIVSIKQAPFDVCHDTNQTKSNQLHTSALDLMMSDEHSPFFFFDET